MKKEFIIRSADIESENIPGIMAEIEAMNLEIHTAVNFDVEEAATHIMLTDTDYVIEYDDGKLEKTREEKLLAELEDGPLSGNNYFIFKENGDVLGRLKRENQGQVTDYLQQIYGDDAINLTIEEDNISWSDAPYLDDPELK